MLTSVSEEHTGGTVQTFTVCVYVGCFGVHCQRRLATTATAMPLSATNIIDASSALIWLLRTCPPVGAGAPVGAGPVGVCTPVSGVVGVGSPVSVGVGPTVSVLVGVCPPVSVLVGVGPPVSVGVGSLVFVGVGSSCGLTGMSTVICVLVDVPVLAGSSGSPSGVVTAGEFGVCPDADALFSMILA